MLDCARKGWCLRKRFKQNPDANQDPDPCFDNKEPYLFGGFEPQTRALGTMLCIYLLDLLWSEVSQVCLESEEKVRIQCKSEERESKDFNRKVTGRFENDKWLVLSERFLSISDGLSAC